MAIVVHREFTPLTHEGDPDDYRPDSELAVVLDPTRPIGEDAFGGA